MPGPDVPLLGREVSIPAPFLPAPAPVLLLLPVDVCFLVRDFVDEPRVSGVVALLPEPVSVADPGAVAAPGASLPAPDEPDVLSLPPDVELPAELPLPDADPALWASTTAGCSKLE